MGLPISLAMTASEMRAAAVLPAGCAYMACHFSAYGTGLSNLPSALPDGAMLIVNDRVPVCGHDPARITGQLRALVEEQRIGAVLLDFQRAGAAQTAHIAAALLSLPCPVGVSEAYADGLRCPVFLPPVPPECPLEEALRPWRGREIWLEAALSESGISLTPRGAASVPAEAFGGTVFPDAALCCHYCVTLSENEARFSLRRTPEDLRALLRRAENAGVTRAVGLYQELERAFSPEEGDSGLQSGSEFGKI